MGNTSKSSGDSQELGHPRAGFNLLICMPSSPLIKSVWCHRPFSPHYPRKSPGCAAGIVGMGPTHRSGHEHVGFSLFTLKIQWLLQVCGQSHRTVQGNQLFLWPHGSWPVPGLGSWLRITQVMGPQCSAAPSLKPKKFPFQPPQSKELMVWRSQGSSREPPAMDTPG